jgi:hypothetical protein
MLSQLWEVETEIGKASAGLTFHVREHTAKKKRSSKEYCGDQNHLQICYGTFSCTLKKRPNRHFWSSIVFFPRLAAWVRGSAVCQSNGVVISSSKERIVLNHFDVGASKKTRFFGRGASVSSMQKQLAE